MKFGSEMSSTVFMKLLESSPSRYDRGMKLLTWGNHLKLIQEISSQYIMENDYILEIGIGTATLAILCAQKGAVVKGIDISPKMLQIATKKVVKSNLEECISLHQMSVVEIDSHLPDKSYDKVIALLVFSELAKIERKYALNQCYRILKPGGLLIIGDEVKPVSKLKKIAYYLIRIPLSLITFLITQVTTNPLENIEQQLKEEHFTIKTASRYFLDSLILIIAKKEV